MKFLKRAVFFSAVLLKSLAFADDLSGPAGTFINQFLNEGSTVTRRSKVNWIGSSVDCVDNSGQKRVDCTVSGGAGLPAGSTDQIQLNQNGAFAATSDFTFSTTTRAMTIRTSSASVSNTAIYIVSPATATASRNPTKLIDWNQANINGVVKENLSLIGEQLDSLSGSENGSFIIEAINQGSLKRIAQFTGGSSGPENDAYLALDDDVSIVWGDVDPFLSNVSATIDYDASPPKFTFSIPIQVASSATVLGQVGLTSIRFPDGTVQVTSATASGGGGSGTPGTPFNSVQLNGGGIFIGTASLTMNTTSNFLSIGATTTFTSVSTTTFQNVSTMTFGNGSALVMSTSTNLQVPSGQILAYGSSVTVQGVLTAGSNITLTPTAGILTIASSGGSGSSIYNATATAGMPFGITASTGVFSSTITTSADSSTVPTIKRSADGTGISFGSSGVYLWDSGTNVINFNSGQSTLSSSLRIDSSESDESVGMINLLQYWAPNNDALTYFGNTIRRQKQNGDLHGYSSGIRDKAGEDTYFYIEPLSDVRRTTGTFHVNVSTFGARRGFVGINVSTPNANLSVGGHIQIATNTATNPVVSACGTGPSVAGHDGQGTITVGSGGIATSCTLTFGSAWTNEPTCSVWHEGAVLYVRPTTTTTALVIDALGAFTASGKIKYSCIGRDQ